MKEINMTVEESVTAVIEEKSQRFYSLGDRGASVFDSPLRRYSYNNEILNYKESSDEELVRSFVETKDEEAFNEIVNRYEDKIFRLALRITRDPCDADDVLQEVFLIVIERLDTFRVESKFSTWLFRVVANASYIHLRVRKKIHDNEVNFENYVSYDEDYVSYNEDGTLRGVGLKDWSVRPDDLLLSKEVMEVIGGAVNELTLPYRVVFHLRDVEGLTNLEVAKVLDLSLTAVKARIHKARLILRDRISGYFYEKGK